MTPGGSSGQAFLLMDHLIFVIVRRLTMEGGCFTENEIRYLGHPGSFFLENKQFREKQTLKPQQGPN